MRISGIQAAATLPKRQTLSHAHIRHIQAAATLSKRPSLRHANTVRIGQHSPIKSAIIS